MKSNLDRIKMSVVYPEDCRSLQLKTWCERCDRCGNCYQLTMREDGGQYLTTLGKDYQMQIAEVKPTGLQRLLGAVTQSDNLYYVGGATLAHSDNDYYNPFDGNDTPVTDLSQYKLKLGDYVCFECMNELRSLKLLKRQMEVCRFPCDHCQNDETTRTLVSVDYYNCAICDCNYPDDNGATVTFNTKVYGVPADSATIFCGYHSVYDQTNFIFVKRLANVVMDESQQEPKIYDDIDEAVTQLGSVEYFTKLAIVSDYLGCQYKLGVNNSVCDSCLGRLWKQGLLLAIGRF